MIVRFDVKHGGQAYHTNSLEPRIGEATALDKDTFLKTIRKIKL